MVPSESPEPLETTHISRVDAVTLGDGHTVAVEAHTRAAPSMAEDYIYLQPGGSIRISITEADDLSSRWEAVIVSPTHYEVRIEVEDIRPDSVVVRQCHPDYGLCNKSIKLFFDLESRTALGRAEFQPLRAPGFVVLDNTLYSVAVSEDRGDDLRDYVVARYDADGPVLIIDGIARDAAIAAVPETSAIRSPETDNPFLESGPLDPAITPQALPTDWIPIFSEPPLWLGYSSNIHGIVEQIGNSYYLYALSQSTPEEFAQRRPAANSRMSFAPGYGPTIEESIGPYTTSKNRLWFGKTFYDGEGQVGIGAFGYFDLNERTYTLFSPPAIADWSASAILVEEDSVWVGLVRRPEGACYSGGLLRYDRTTGGTRVYPIDHVIGQIQRWNDALYLGTQAGGIYLVREGITLARYVFEPALNGGFEILAVNNNRYGIREVQAPALEDGHSAISDRPDLKGRRSR